MPIDPSFAVSGAEWQIARRSRRRAATAGVPTPASARCSATRSQSLTKTQTDAAGASQALATGQATDPTAVVMAVERAQLAMQLASQIRTKAVEAAQDIFHTQV